MVTDDKEQKKEKKLFLFYKINSSCLYSKNFYPNRGKLVCFSLKNTSALVWYLAPGGTYSKQI